MLVSHKNCNRENGYWNQYSIPLTSGDTHDYPQVAIRPFQRRSQNELDLNLQLPHTRKTPSSLHQVSSTPSPNK